MTACKRDFRGAIKDCNYRAQHRADRHHRNPAPGRAVIHRNSAPDPAPATASRPRALRDVCPRFALHLV